MDACLVCTLPEGCLVCTLPGDCLVCALAGCIPDSHPYRITSTKCRINTAVSPDGHIVARNMLRKEINILNKIVHQIGFIYKIKTG